MLLRICKIWPIVEVTKVLCSHQAQSQRGSRRRQQVMVRRDGSDGRQQVVVRRDGSDGRQQAAVGGSRTLMNVALGALGYWQRGTHLESATSNIVRTKDRLILLLLTSDISIGAHSK